MNTSKDPHVQANQTLWDAWTKLHLRPGIYGVEAFKVGQTSLKALERDELGDVSGKTLLHLQCHFGLDTLSWAREGAVVTGVDFSPAAVAAARALRDEVGVPARFVCSDIYALPDAPDLRGERFDVVFTSYGTVTWLPDLARWARVIAHFLTPGGVFYMVDRHPFVRLLFPRRTDNRGNPLDLGYFFRPEPVRAEEHGSYADPESEVWTTAYYWSHSLGEIVTALCDAGLRIEYLHEFPPDEEERKLVLDGEAQRGDFPAWFSIRATASPPDRLTPPGPLRPAGAPRTRPAARPARREPTTAGAARPATSAGKIKYYWPEHEEGYQRAEREGLAGWNELHGGHGFDNFSSRAFLEQALPMLRLPISPADTDVLEYGCGTGPGACFLATRGFRVDAVDLSPTAIKLARRFARARGLPINFTVQDVCAAADRPPEKRYDVIVDSYCLQSVVTDADRARLFAFVRARLKPAGSYLVSTAMFDPERSYEDHERYDPATGVVYDRVRGDPERYDGAVQIDGTWCLPNRRHLTPPALRRELEAGGFRVVWQGGKLGGDLICARDDGDPPAGFVLAAPAVAAPAECVLGVPITSATQDERRLAATFRRFGQIEERLP